MSGRISRQILLWNKFRFRNSPAPATLLSSGRLQQQKLLHAYDQSHSLSYNTVVGCRVSLLHNSTLNPYSFQRPGFSTAASPDPDEKDACKNTENASSNASEKDEVCDQTKTAAPGSTSDPEQESGSDDDMIDISVENLEKLVAEKDEILKAKNKQIETMKDKVLRTYAEMENVMDRTRREAENSKKFAIQNFAKDLLDVADNMSRASSVVKDSFAKMDTSEGSTGAVPLLKTLLEGVEMTEKQLNEVFKKFGVEKYDPTNEKFDPNMHNAVYQVPDSSKPPGTVASVLKSGYKLHDRILRPAEVGVTTATDETHNSEK